MTSVSSESFQMEDKYKKKKTNRKLITSYFSMDLMWTNIMFWDYIKFFWSKTPLKINPTVQKRIATQAKAPSTVKIVNTVVILWDKRAAASISCRLIIRRSWMVLYSAQIGPIRKKHEIVRINAHVKWTGMVGGFNLTAFFGVLDTCSRSGDFFFWSGCECEWNRWAWSCFADSWTGDFCDKESKFSDGSAICSRFFQYSVIIKKNKINRKTTRVCSGRLLSDKEEKNKFFNHYDCNWREKRKEKFTVNFVPSVI